VHIHSAHRLAGAICRAIGKLDCEARLFAAMSEWHHVKRFGEVRSGDGCDGQLGQWVRSPAQSRVDNRDRSHEIQPGCDIDLGARQRRNRQTFDKFDFLWNPDRMALEHPG